MAMHQLQLQPEPGHLPRRRPARVLAQPDWGPPDWHIQDEQAAIERSDKNELF